jgi:hypothetical protein
MPAYDDSRFAPPAPVAHVVIRHPDLGEAVSDVPMLIDSGADASLLPKSAIESLGIVGTGERYQLIAFDGTTSESEAVRADLVFMGRRFRGRYRLIESEIGVLGRDILNHLRLLLDGPKKTWDLSSTPLKTT